MLLRIFTKTNRRNLLSLNLLKLLKLRRKVNKEVRVKAGMKKRNKNDKVMMNDTEAKQAISKYMEKENRPYNVKNI